MGIAADKKREYCENGQAAARHRLECTIAPRAAAPPALITNDKEANHAPHSIASRPALRAHRPAGRGASCGRSQTGSGGSGQRLPQPRARDLGIPFDGTPGPLNAITDVAGVLVGHTTLISGSGKLKVGQGPVRTGVTAVLPRGADSISDPVFAAWFAQNGNGEMTGTTWIEESGFLDGPVMITNTHSVGVVRDAVIQWRVAHGNAGSGR